jgi:aconitate hydratase
VRAVIARSYERIHRSNLIGMGILPLQFRSGEDAASLGLSGDEEYDIDLGAGVAPAMDVRVVVRGGAGGDAREFTTLARVDSPVEVRYLANGGILHAVLRDLLRTSQR